MSTTSDSVSHRVLEQYSDLAGINVDVLVKRAVSDGIIVDVVRRADLTPGVQRVYHLAGSLSDFIIHAERLAARMQKPMPRDDTWICHHCGGESGSPETSHRHASIDG